MGRIPPPFPPWLIPEEVRFKMKVQRIYRDRNKRRISWEFWYLLAVLAPFWISVIIKLWTGEWVVW